MSTLHENDDHENPVMKNQIMDFWTRKIIEYKEKPGVTGEQTEDDGMSSTVDADEDEKKSDITGEYTGDDGTSSTVDGDEDEKKCGYAKVNAANNKYFLPRYFDILEKNRLPLCTLWSNITLGDLQRFSEEYIYEVPPFSVSAKNIFVNNSTNANSENLYSTLKRNPCHLKTPLVTFIDNSWAFICGLRHQWTDELFEGQKNEQKNEKTKKGKPVNKKAFDNLTSSLHGKSSHKCKKKFAESEEEWSKKDKKSAIHPSHGTGLYRPENNPDVNITSTPDELHPGIVKEKAFLAFKDEIWENEAVNSPVPAECKKKILNKWKRLTPAVRSSYLENAEKLLTDEEYNCVCNGKSKDGNCVGCDCCNDWLH